MTRYEQENRNSKENRTKKIVKVSAVNYHSIKNDFEDTSDIFYLFMCMEEIYPNFGF